MNEPGQTMPEITDEYAESVSDRYITLCVRTTMLPLYLFLKISQVSKVTRSLFFYLTTKCCKTRA